MKSILIYIAIFFGLILIVSAGEIGIDLIRDPTDVTTWIGNISNFTGLSDTPAAYTGQGGNCVKVGSGEAALEFGSCATGGNASWNESGANLLYAGIEWDYNQTEEVVTLFNTNWSSTYNATYEAGSNTSWNQSGANLLYAGIEWNYNQTTSAYFYNMTPSAYFYNMTPSAYFYNQSAGTFNAWNTVWLSTYNATYEAGSNVSWNQSFAHSLFDTTYNATYASYALNVSLNYSLLTYNNWNTAWLSTYNATYEASGNLSWNESGANLRYAGIEWDYNQSLETYGLYSSEWNSTYNATYEASVGNASWNESGANLLYVGNNSAGWYLNVTKLWTTMFHTLTSDFEWTVTDDGSDMFMDFSEIGGTNSLFIETAGTFLEMIANPGPSNDYEMFAFEETQGADTAINFYEGGSGHNRIWDSGSLRIGGGKSSLCSNLTSDVDCVSGALGMGADLVVADDGWFGGKLFATDWSNISGAYNTTYQSYALNVSLNYSLLTYNNWNTDWLSTYNITYSDWNESYADTLYIKNNTIGWNLTFINLLSLNWTNITIIENQISDLAHTPLTNISFTNNSNVFIENQTMEGIFFAREPLAHKIYDNSTCIIMTGNTSILEVC